MKETVSSETKQDIDLNEFEELSQTHLEELYATNKGGNSQVTPPPPPPVTQAVKEVTDHARRLVPAPLDIDLIDETFVPPAPQVDTETQRLIRKAAKGGA